jgi:hypothetical protein
MTDGDKCILIIERIDLDYLLEQFSQKELFAFQFKFYDRKLFTILLKSLKINYKDFANKYYYYDEIRNLHISESEFGYVWISTFGLIAKHKTTTNSAVNSCANQYTVISLLLEKAIEISKKENVYDVDSYSFGSLTELSPALFHNALFYIEVFCKAYLSLNDIAFPQTHKLSVIYQKTIGTMFIRKHNNSLFQVRIMEPLYKFVNHINELPKNFREHFVKYDDNPQDNTIIIFEPTYLNETKIIFELSYDFIMDYFYMGTETHYLKTNLYQRMLDKAETVEKKKKIKNKFSYLVEQNGK